MRIPTALALFAAVVVSASAVALSARADGEPPAEAARNLGYEAQIASLKADVDLLREQVAALSRSAGATATASNALRTGTANARNAGFEAAAVAAPSRTALLAGLDAFSAELRGAAPAATREEAELRRKADQLRTAAGWPK